MEDLNIASMQGHDLGLLLARIQMIHQQTAGPDCEGLSADFVALYLAHHHTMPSLDGKPPVARQSQCTCACQRRKQGNESVQLYGSPKEDIRRDNTVKPSST